MPVTIPMLEAEIARLRAELATWRNIAESHEPATRLRQAEFVRMDSELGRLRAELAEAYRLRDAHHTDAINSRLELEELRDTNETLRKRVAELEAQVWGLKNFNIVMEKRAEQAEAHLQRINADFINYANVDTGQRALEAEARAEQAEAQLARALEENRRVRKDYELLALAPSLSERSCTCNPNERPYVCQRKYAFRECWAAAHAAPSPAGEKS
jgi:chromosome segregation ATPase